MGWKPTPGHIFSNTSTVQTTSGNITIRGWGGTEAGTGILHAGLALQDTSVVTSGGHVELYGKGEMVPHQTLDSILRGLLYNCPEQFRFQLQEKALDQIPAFS